MRTWVAALKDTEVKRSAWPVPHLRQATWPVFPEVSRLEMSFQPVSPNVICQPVGSFCHDCAPWGPSVDVKVAPIGAAATAEATAPLMVAATSGLPVPTGLSDSSRTRTMIRVKRMR